MGYGTRYGSYDIVGCGITRNGDVYFTLNGMLLPLINVELKGQVYALVSMRGMYTSVSVEMGPDFVFNHEEILMKEMNLISELYPDQHLMLEVLKDEEFCGQVETFAKGPSVSWRSLELAKQIEKTKYCLKMEESFTYMLERTSSKLLSSKKRSLEEKKQEESLKEEQDNMSMTNNTNDNKNSIKHAFQHDSKGFEKNELIETIKPKGKKGKKMTIGESIEVEEKRKLLGYGGCALGSKRTELDNESACAKNKKCCIF